VTRRATLRGLAALSLAALARSLPTGRADAAAVVYQVQPGDTPGTLARRFGVSVATLGVAGDPADPSTLHAGQFLVFAAPNPPASPPAAPTGGSAAPSRGANVVAIATKYIGSPYVWGGAAPGGFDCSGFAWFVYRQAGHPIPRDLWGQLQSGASIARANLQPGDLVFFANTYEPGLSHVGIYLGGNRFVHAEDYGTGVVVSDLAGGYWAGAYYAACRPGS
jgi:peptidoglycan endopeptidase LytE